MKKIAIITFLSFILILPNIFAQDAAAEDTVQEDKDAGRIEDRSFELGLANLGFGLSNTFLSLEDILQEHLVINLDGLKDGLAVNFNVGGRPLYFSYNKDDQWGFGLDIGVEAYGSLDLAGEMLTFQEAKDVKSNFTASAFAGVSVPVFFKIPGVPIIEDIKFKVKPSLYYPIVYAKPEISYTYGADGATILNLNVNARVYTASSFEEDSAFDLTATPGIDFAIGAEFPLSEAIGLNKILPFLDFDVGIDLIGIPMISSSMSDYMELNVEVGGDKPINVMDPEMSENLIKIPEDPSYGSLDKDDAMRITRPFKMLAWADWRPLMGSKFLTVTPAIGFAVNPLYDEKGSFEGGLKAKLDLANMFMVTAGVGYYDRLWKNSLDLAFNLRAFELDLGVSLQAPEFADSWNGHGIGLALGLKFGW
jgi:hypothetical protein